MKLAALLVANSPQMPPCMKLMTLLGAHYFMLSTNSAITDINKTSILLLVPQVLLNIDSKPLQPPLLAKLVISAILEFL
jgi:hypothetical protein